MAVFTLVILLFRLWIQDFTKPNFRVEDNPIAAADERLTRILSQNFLYAMNFFLLLMPDWLSFDWSFASIELVEDFKDFRVGLTVLFYIIMIAVGVVGLKNRQEIKNLWKFQKKFNFLIF